MGCTATLKLFRRYSPNLDWHVNFIYENILVGEITLTTKGVKGLHLAIQFNQLAVVRFLLDHNIVDVNCTTDANLTALHIAAAQGDVSITDFLITAGARIQAADVNGNLPLHLAASFGEWDVAELLLKAGSSQGPNKEGCCPEILADLRGHQSFVKSIRLFNQSLVKSKQPID
jgi:ankyrin repeat protein